MSTAKLYWYQYWYQNTRWNPTTVLDDAERVDVETARQKIERMGYPTRIASELPTNPPTDEEKSRVNKFAPGLLK